MCGFSEEKQEAGVAASVDLWLNEVSPIALIVRSGEDGTGLNVESYAFGADDDAGTLVRKSIHVHEDHPLYDLFAKFALGVTLTAIVDAMSSKADIDA